MKAKSNKKLKTVALEEILNLKNLKDKQYTSKIENNLSDEPIDIELQLKGSDSNNIYVGSKRFSVSDNTKQIRLDENWLPYFEVTLGPIQFPSYREIFLHNVSLATAWGHENENLLKDVLKIIKEEKHPLYQEFTQYINGLIKKAPKIKEAKDKEHYFNDTTELGKFSSLDIKIFEYLNKRDYTFIFWYKNYMASKGYEDKITTSKSINKALEDWVKRVEIELRRHEFRKVDQLTYI